MLTSQTIGLLQKQKCDCLLTPKERDGVPH